MYSTWKSGVLGPLKKRGWNIMGPMLPVPSSQVTQWPAVRTWRVPTRAPVQKFATSISPLGLKVMGLTMRPIVL
jgi:hypothetical protein